MSQDGHVSWLKQVGVSFKWCRAISSNKFTSTTFKVCPPRVLSFQLTPCFSKWDMFIKGKTALVTGAATGIGLEYVKALLKNGAQVSYICWLHCHVRAMVETRLHSHDSLRESGCFVDKQYYFFVNEVCLLQTGICNYVCTWFYASLQDH